MAIMETDTLMAAIPADNETGESDGVGEEEEELTIGAVETYW